MRLISAFTITTLIMCSASAQSPAALAEENRATATSAAIGNDFVERHVSWGDGRLATQTITNRVGQTQMKVAGGDEFELTIRLASKETDLQLTSADFRVQESTSDGKNTSLKVQLAGNTAPLDVTIHYFAKAGEPWMRKQLTVTPRQPIQIRKILVEHLAAADAYAPYQADQLTAQGRAKWRPPLGQPLYTKTSGIWFGSEFPAARNEVRSGERKSQLPRVDAVVSRRQFAAKDCSRRTSMHYQTSSACGPRPGIQEHCVWYNSLEPSGSNMLAQT